MWLFILGREKNIFTYNGWLHLIRWKHGVCCMKVQMCVVWKLIKGSLTDVAMGKLTGEAPPKSQTPPEKNGCHSVLATLFPSRKKKVFCLSSHHCSTANERSSRVSKWETTARRTPSFLQWTFLPWTGLPVQPLPL